MSFSPDFISIENSHLTLRRTTHETITRKYTNFSKNTPKKNYAIVLHKEKQKRKTKKPKNEENKKQAIKNLFTNTKLLEANVFSQAVLYLKLNTKNQKSEMQIFTINIQNYTIYASIVIY